MALTGRGDLIYADQAATSWPKPPEVVAAMTAYMQEAGANPGRSGHRLAVEAARRVFLTRCRLAELLGITDESRVVFVPGATWAINVALYGLLRPGDEVITSSMEHNAVARPLFDLSARGVVVRRVLCDREGRLDPEDVRRAMTDRTRLVVMTHASNVTGTLLPAAEVGRLARERGIAFLLDAAQTAGCVPLDVQELHVDLLALTGHKGLLGPQGTGALYIREGLDPTPLVRGGTGSFSHLDSQPEQLPDRHESGTINGPGLAGLGAALEVIAERGVDAIRLHEMELADRLLGRLREVPRVRVYGPMRARARVPVVSFNIEGMDPAEVGWRLDEQFGIMVRTGLHCAPWAHRTIGTYPRGTVRISLGYSNTDEEVDRILAAIQTLAEGGR